MNPISITDRAHMSPNLNTLSNETQLIRWKLRSHYIQWQTEAPQKCLKERSRRSILPVAVRLENQKQYNYAGQMCNIYIHMCSIVYLFNSGTTV